MRTLEETQTGLRECALRKSCSVACPYYEAESYDCVGKLMDDVRCHILQLKAECDALLADFKLYRERNINRTSGVYACDLCQHGGEYMEIEEIKCPEGCDGVKHFKWRGAKTDGGAKC